jgi:hypothetical protein
MNGTCEGIGVSMQEKLGRKIQSMQKRKRT